MTIVCVNPNPAVDRVAVVDFARGGTLRPIRSFEWPGGSGVHAAHVAQQLGASTEVVAPVGGDYGRRFLELARSHALVVRLVANTAETRSTFSLLDVREGNICDVAEFGGAADEGVGDALVREFESAVGRANVCVLSGSLLEGLPADTYARMVEICHRSDVPVIVDATGDALLAVTRTPVFLLKASLEELARDGVLGAEGTAAAVLDRTAQWLAAGVSNVCVSLGSAGLVWASSDGVALLAADRVAPYNTIGCGDALVGAVAAALDHGRSLADGLAMGVAAATANLSYDAPGHCTMNDVRRLLPSVRCEVRDESAVARAIAESRPK